MLGRSATDLQRGAERARSSGRASRRTSTAIALPSREGEAFEYPCAGRSRGPPVRGLRVARARSCGSCPARRGGAPLGADGRRRPAAAALGGVGYGVAFAGGDKGGGGRLCERAYAIASPRSSPTWSSSRLPAAAAPRAPPKGEGAGHQLLPLGLTRLRMTFVVAGPQRRPTDGSTHLLDDLRSRVHRHSREGLRSATHIRRSFIPRRTEILARPSAPSGQRPPRRGSCRTGALVAAKRNLAPPSQRRPHRSRGRTNPKTSSSQ